MNDLIESTPLSPALGRFLAILVLFALAWLITRFAAAAARWLVGRSELRYGTRAGRFIAESLREELRQRETAVALIQTSIRYVVYGVAIVLSIAVLIGARRIETIVGASFLAIIIGFAAQRFLADVIAGLLLFFERWFQVGDTIRVEPLGVVGLVEDVSLRYITLRSVDGEVVRVANSHVQAVRVLPAGGRRISVEFYASDPETGRRLIESTATLLPASATDFVRRPYVQSVEAVGEGLSRIVATATVAPGREWLATDLLPTLLKERGEGVLVHGPIVTPLDEEASSRFERAYAGGAE